MSKSIPAALLLAASSLSAADLSKTAASAINDFGIDLLVHAAKPQENTALSPYSIQIALAMTFAGAEGDTREQMAKVLHYPANEANVSDSFRSVNKTRSPKWQVARASSQRSRRRPEDPASQLRSRWQIGFLDSKDTISDRPTSPCSRRPSALRLKPWIL